LINRLEELVLDDRVDEAVGYVSEKNAGHIASLILPDTMEQAPEKFDRFIRLLYASLESAYAKADLVHHFRAAYLDELSHLDSAFFALRDLSLDMLIELADRMTEEIDILDTLVGCPDKVIPQATHERLLGYAEQIKAMDFRPTNKENASHEHAMAEEFGSSGDDRATWLELYRVSQLVLVRSSAPETHGPSLNRLEELVISDRIDEALAYVSEMNAGHTGSLMGYEALEQAPDKFDRFIRRLYDSLDSPYAKADAAYNLAGSYITALSYLDNAFFADRDLALGTLAVLAGRMAEDVEILDTLVGCPDKVIPPATYERFLGYAEQLRAMNFQPTPEESAPHERAITAEFESISEDAVAWLELYRGSQINAVLKSKG
jgi:hypothetical protein